MITHLKDHEYYQNIYDRVTVDLGRSDTDMFQKMYDKFFKIMPDEPHNSPRAVLHLNLIYMVFVGNNLIDRYDKRDNSIKNMMARDQTKDDLIANARLTVEPECLHCGNKGLRITDKMLLHRTSFDQPEEVIFMLRCGACKRHSAAWADGTALEHRETLCPKCSAEMTEKQSVSAKSITTTYTCPACSHTYKDKIDLAPKKEKPDPEFEEDKRLYCLEDQTIRDELRTAKWRYEEMARLGREWKEKEENKHIYDAIKELKKPKIAELTELLAPALEKAGYVEFSLDKPEMGHYVVVGFNCLDSKAGRSDYESQKTLKKQLDRLLLNTNWRIMNDGVYYRLGYLSGRLRAYEQEEDLKKLILKDGRIKSKKASDREKENAYRIKGKSGEDIIL